MEPPFRLFPCNNFSIKPVLGPLTMQKLRLGTIAMVKTVLLNFVVMMLLQEDLDNCG
jgi:hypothetical protein